MQVGSLIGQTVAGRFHITSLIGSGAMGEVYLAEHETLERRYAIKVLKAALAGDASLAERFRREAYATSRLEHPNIVTIIDFGRLDSGQPYLVMEHIPGESLRETLDIEPLRPLATTRAIRIFSQLSQAIDTAHQADIVHRDLKPENVLLTPRPDGTDGVKILDFGLVKLMGFTDSQLTRQGEIFGTPKYMSPEQGMGRETDHRTDIYSLGIIAYEMLTGSVPFDYPSVPRVLLAHRNDAPEPLHLRRPDDLPPIPEELGAVVLCCLAKDPAERPASMAEVLEEIAPLESRLPTPSAENLAVMVTKPTTEDSPSLDWEPLVVEVTLTGPWRTSTTGAATKDAPQAWRQASADRTEGWQDAVTQAKDLAGQLRRHHLGQERLEAILTRLTRLEQQNRHLEDELDRAHERLEAVGTAVREGEARLRHALLDLSLERNRQRDTREATRDTQADLAYQIRELERRLAELRRECDEKMAKLTTAIQKRQSYLAIYRQKQVDVEIVLLNALQKLRPEPCPPELLHAYDRVSDSLKALPC